MWFMSDDKLWDSKKVRRLGKDKAAAMGVWILSGTWAAGIDRDGDGFVPASKLTEFGDTPRHKYAKRLCDENLWTPGVWDGEAGYFFHDWLDYQKSAEEKAIKRAEREAALDARRAATRERVRQCRARKRGSSARNSGASLRGTGAGTYVIQATEGALTDADYTPSELDEHDSLTGGPRQCNADGNARGNALPYTHTHTSTSSGDLGGGGTDPYERATDEPLPPRKPRPTNHGGGLARPRLLRPLDADPKLCDEHWPLRYRDTHESVPKCTPCKTRRERVEAVEAQTADVEAKAIALMAELRRNCDGCDPSGWELSEDGRTVVAPMRKHDCAAYALANEQMAAA
jgi:hypothetical protein